MENHKKEHHTGGSRLEQKPKYIKKYRKQSRLTTQQKVLVVIAVLLAVALIAVLAWKSLFVRPDVGNKPSQADPSGSSSTMDEYKRLVEAS